MHETLGNSAEKDGNGAACSAMFRNGAGRAGREAAPRLARRGSLGEKDAKHSATIGMDANGARCAKMGGEDAGFAGKEAAGTEECAKCATMLGTDGVGGALVAPPSVPHLRIQDETRDGVWHWGLARPKRASRWVLRFSQFFFWSFYEISLEKLPHLPGWWMGVPTL